MTHDNIPASHDVEQDDLRKRHGIDLVTVFSTHLQNLERLQHQFEMRLLSTVQSDIIDDADMPDCVKDVLLKSAKHAQVNNEDRVEISETLRRMHEIESAMCHMLMDEHEARGLQRRAFLDDLDLNGLQIRFQSTYPNLCEDLQLAEACASNVTEILQATLERKHRDMELAAGQGPHGTGRDESA